MDQPTAKSIDLESIIANAPQFIFWKNTESVYLGCNENFAYIAGLKSAKDIAGKTDYDLPWSKFSANIYREEDRIIVDSGQSLEQREVPLITAQNKKIIVLVSKRPLFDERGNVTGILGIYMDITERKQQEVILQEAKEHAEAADKAKTEFLMNMRHDIRTPLSGIIGFAGLIKDEVKHGSIAEYADNMLASSQALLDFLNEVLEGIKITSGEIPLLKKKFDLREKLLSVVTLNQAKARQKNLWLNFDYDEHLPKYLLGDAKRLQRIVLELISNALNFTHQGEISVKVEFANEDHREVTFKLIVSDTGIGIPKDKLEEVFIRFTRLNPAYEGIYKGIGIGLTIIKQFIDDLDGEIYVDSAVGKGSTFTCIFRFKKALLEDEQGVDHSVEIMPIKDAALTYTTLTAPQAEQSTKSDVRILIVEDSQIAALVIEKLLTRLGCHVDVAVDGQSGLIKAKLNTYDGIFMDVGLPDISGNEVTRAFRAWESNLEEDRRTPIIALTAHVETEEKQICIESGMDAVLSKPLTQEKAVDILAAFIPKYADRLLPLKATLPLADETTETLPTISGKAIDLELASKVVGDVELAKEMLKLLIEAILEERKNLSKAYNDNNWKDIQAIAHKLKGSSSYCGAVRLNEASTHLQNYLKAEKTKLRDALYKQMLDEMDLVNQEYNTFK